MFAAVRNSDHSYISQNDDSPYVFADIARFFSTIELANHGRGRRDSGAYTKMAGALREVVPIFNKGGLSPDLVKATGQMTDMFILAEAKATGLPLLTNNAADFHVNAVGGGRLAERVGVPVLKTNVVPKHLPRLGDILKSAARKVL